MNQIMAIEDRTEQLVFPALAFSKGHMSFIDSLQRLTTCSAVAMKKGFYRGLFLIDSAGRSWLVKEARRAGTIGPFWGFSLFRTQKLKVILALGEAELLALEEAKAKVLSSLARDRAFWEAGGDYDVIELGVREAKNFPALIQALSDPNSV